MRRHPNVLARLLRGPADVVPDPLLPGLFRKPCRRTPDVRPTTHAARTRVPAPPALCGHCTHGYAGHGRQYGALVGWHDWAPEVITGSPRTGPWPHHTPEETR